jgi:hypothetical protein
MPHRVRIAPPSHSKLQQTDGLSAVPMGLKGNTIFLQDRFTPAEYRVICCAVGELIPQEEADVYLSTPKW